MPKKKQRCDLPQDNAEDVGTATTYTRQKRRLVAPRPIQQAMRDPQQLIYMALKEIPGLEDEEIRAAVTLAQPGHSLDDLIIWIVQQRADNDAARLQEDADMDMAILNSEGERDIIQQRKKMRLEELRADCRVDFTDPSSCPEFSTSLLLRRPASSSSSPPSMVSVSDLIGSGAFSGSNVLWLAARALNAHASTCTISISCEDHGIGRASIDTNLSGNKNNNESNSNKGCAGGGVTGAREKVDLCRERVNVDPSPAPDPAPVSAACVRIWDPCSCKPWSRTLRSLVARLLLLETDAKKFYSKKCDIYFFYLAKAIDFKHGCIAADSESLSWTALSALLTETIGILEKSLYSLPRDSAAATLPRLFRESSVAASIEAETPFKQYLEQWGVSAKLSTEGDAEVPGNKRYSMDEDGLEVVEDKRAIARDEDSDEDSEPFSDED